ncbi:uncharacterized protein [Physcomitrium patens]|uniref:uncharacterized protein n=1 Tax=Physcomitrium patens TaxID=3218 RepID=UPI003CCD4FA2
MVQNDSKVNTKMRIQLICLHNLPRGMMPPFHACTFTAQTCTVSPCSRRTGINLPRPRLRPPPPLQRIRGSMRGRETWWWKLIPILLFRDIVVSVMQIPNELYSLCIKLRHLKPLCRYNGHSKSGLPLRG